MWPDWCSVRKMQKSVSCWVYIVTRWKWYSTVTHLSIASMKSYSPIWLPLDIRGKSHVCLHPPSTLKVVWIPKWVISSPSIRTLLFYSKRTGALHRGLLRSSHGVCEIPSLSNAKWRRWGKNAIFSSYRTQKTMTEVLEWSREDVRSNGSIH